MEIFQKKDTNPKKKLKSLNKRLLIARLLTAILKIYMQVTGHSKYSLAVLKCQIFPVNLPVYYQLF